MKIKLLLVVCVAVGCLAAPSKDDSGKKDDQTQTDDSKTDKTHWYDGIMNFFKSIAPDVGFGSHGKLTNYPNGNQNKVGANQKLSLDLGENAGTLELDYRRERKSDSDWLGVGYRYPLDSNGHYAFVKVENNLEEGNSSFIWDLDGKYDKLSREREAKKKKQEEDRQKELHQRKIDLDKRNNTLIEDESALHSEIVEYEAAKSLLERCSLNLNSDLAKCKPEKSDETGQNLKNCVMGATNTFNSCMNKEEPTLS